MRKLLSQSISVTGAAVMLLLACVLHSNTAHAQAGNNKSMTRTTVWKFQLPQHQPMGPVNILATFEYYFERSSFGGKPCADLKIKLTKTELAAVDGTPGFKYNNEMWTGNELSGIDGADDALTGFRDIKITGLSYSVDILEAGNSRRLNYDNTFINYNNVLPITAQTDLNHITIMWSSVITTEISFTNSSKLQSRIDACIKLHKDRDAYKKLIWAADEDMRNNKLADAKTKYQKASQLLYREDYPKKQIAKIDELLAKQNKPQPNNGTNNTNTTGSKPNTTNTTAHPNENGTYSKGNLKPGSNDKTSSDDDYWNTGKTNNTSSNNAQSGRQAAIPAGTAPMIKDKEGNHYVQDNTGKYVKTTQANYEAVKQAYNTEKNKPAQDALKAQKQKEEQAALDEFYGGQNKMLDQLNAQQQKNTSIDVLAANSYYAAQAKNNAQQGMYDLSRLEGSFESLEELNAAFQQQYAATYDQQQYLMDAGRNNVSATMDQAFNNSNETVAAFKPLANTLGNMASDAAAERQAREARERLKTERAEMEAEIKARQLRALISMRQELVKKFPEGGVPLSFHKVPGNDLYFFSYVLAPETLGQERPTVQVSNVYQVQRSGDGTWPLKSSIAAELKRASGATAGKPVMVGYYTDKSQATQMHDAFTDIAAKCAMDVKTFSYKGRRSSGGSGGNADMWNSGAAPKNAGGSNTAAPARAATTDDMWNSGNSKKTEPKPANKNTQGDDYWNSGSNKKQEEKPASTNTNNDYWK